MRLDAQEPPILELCVYPALRVTEFCVRGAETDLQRRVVCGRTQDCGEWSVSILRMVCSESIDVEDRKLVHRLLRIVRRAAPHCRDVPLRWSGVMAGLSAFGAPTRSMSATVKTIVVVLAPSPAMAPLTNWSISTWGIGENAAVLAVVAAFFEFVSLGIGLCRGSCYASHVQLKTRSGLPIREPAIPYKPVVKNPVGVLSRLRTHKGWCGVVFAGSFSNPLKCGLAAKERCSGCVTAPPGLASPCSRCQRRSPERFLPQVSS